MSTKEARRLRESGPDELQISDFYDAFRELNPFASVRVNEPSPYDIDVESIHADAFTKIIARAEDSVKHRRGVGVALMGAAGTGKSHLLSRLSRWAHGQTDKKHPRACYVFLHNVLADPERLPRYLLKYVVNVLTLGRRGPLRETPLYGLVDHAVRFALKESPNRFSRRPTLEDGGVAFRSLLNRSMLDDEVVEALFQFYRYAFPIRNSDPNRENTAQLAVSWLSGEEIDAETAKALSLRVRDDEPVELSDDQKVEQVFLALSQLALIRDQPLVLCVDQVDNLDPEKVNALTRFLHVLIDHSPNLLVITSGIRSALLQFHQDGAILDSTWDRIAEYRVELRRIKRDDARRILEARLERFLEPFLHLEPIRRHIVEDTLFPLGRQWLEQELKDGIEFNPRHVLIWARDAWEDQRSTLDRLGEEAWVTSWPSVSPVILPAPEPPSEQEIEAAIDGKIDRKIEEQIERHRLQPGSLPPDAGNLTGLTLALLEQCRGEGLPYTFRNVERLRKTKGRLPPFDLLVQEHREADGQEIKTGIQFITNTGTSASRALGRLLNYESVLDHRLLVTDQERRPLTVGTQGMAYYKDLKKLGAEAFEHVKLSFEDYARLDALQAIVGQARVGDLEVEIPRGTIRKVSEEEVIASHHRQDRYRAHPLLRHLLTEEPPSQPTTVSPSPPTIDESGARQYIVAQLALIMGTTDLALAKSYIKSVPGLKLELDQTRSEFRRIIERLHAEGKVYATPTEGDLYVQLLG